MAKSIQQVRVTAVTRQVPGVVSIDFEPGGLSPRVFVDDHVKIMLPAPGPEHLSAPDSQTLPAAGSETLSTPDPAAPAAQATQPAPAPAPLLRTYTRRRADPATGAWGIDVLRLPHDGPGARWADSVAPGDVVTVRGPGGHWQMPDSTEPMTVLMVGDAVAQPAIANALEALPADSSAVVLVEQGDLHYPLPQRPGVRIVPVPVSPGGAALVDAVRDLATPSGPWWAFVHGQAEMVRPLRRHLRVDRGLPKERMHLSAYWFSGRDTEAWRAIKSRFNKAMIAESGD